MAWFAVRAVYLFGRKNDGMNIFEERIVCFEADSADAALTAAEEESERYADFHNLEAYPELHSYELDDDKLVSGIEIWSTLYQSNQSLEEFYEQRYVACDYHSD